MTEPTNLTAEQARKLMPPKAVAVELDAIFAEIAKAARSGRDSIRMPPRDYMTIERGAE